MIKYDEKRFLKIIFLRKINLKKQKKSFIFLIIIIIEYILNIKKNKNTNYQDNGINLLFIIKCEFVLGLCFSVK